MIVTEKSKREAKARNALRVVAPDAEPRVSGLLTTEQARTKRNVWCPFYERCLDVAIAGEWASWHCAGCSYRSLESKPAPDGEARDRSRLEG